jgi:hypothetical protein
MDDDKKRQMWHGRQASMLAGYFILWTTHHPPVLFQSENRGSNFLGQKIRIKEPLVPVITTTSENRWVSWKNQQGYRSSSLNFFPFLRTMVIYMPEPVFSIVEKSSDHIYNLRFFNSSHWFKATLLCVNGT